MIIFLVSYYISRPLLDYSLYRDSNPSSTMSQRPHRRQSLESNGSSSVPSHNHRITNGRNQQRPILTSALRNGDSTHNRQEHDYNSDSDCSASYDCPDNIEEHIKWSTANNTNIIPRVLLPKRTPISQLSTTFFGEHPNHDTEDHIYEKMQKYGLLNCMNRILVDRRDLHERRGNNNKTSNAKSNKKRKYSEIAHTEFNAADGDTSPEIDTELASVSSCFLKSGSTFYLSSDPEVDLKLKFANVSSGNQNISGFFQSSSVSIPFTAKNIDFVQYDLRCQESGKFGIELSIFDNMLRKFFFPSWPTFLVNADRDRKIMYTMDKYGYLGYESLDKKKKLSPIRHKIKYPRKTKFPNTSVFHKIEDTCGNTSTTFKFLSKWFDLPPFNEFLKTPSPPTPPYGKRKCINNPENMLGCNHCINSVLKNYILLELNINIEDLLYFSGTGVKEELPIIPDLLYKKKRCLKETLLRQEPKELLRSVVRYWDSRGMSYPFRKNFSPAQQIETIIHNQIRESEDEDMMEFELEGLPSSDEFETESFEPQRSSGRSRRLENMLFQRDDREGRIFCRVFPISAVKLYKNCKDQPLTLKLLVSISRITGEVYIVPGNLDRNNWSAEENCGELIPDYESFRQLYLTVFKYISSKEVRLSGDPIKKYFMSLRQQSQKVMLLLMLCRPALLDSSWRDKPDGVSRTLTNDRDKKNNFSKVACKNNGDFNKRHKRALSHEHDEIKESYMAYYNDKVKLGFDPHKVLRMKPHNGKHKKSEGSLKGELNPIGSTYSFELA